MPDPEFEAIEEEILAYLDEWDEDDVFKHLDE